MGCFRTVLIRRFFLGGRLYRRASECLFLQRLVTGPSPFLFLVGSVLLFVNSLDAIFFGLTCSVFKLIDPTRTSPFSSVRFIEWSTLKIVTSLMSKIDSLALKYPGTHCIHPNHQTVSVERSWWRGRSAHPAKCQMRRTFHFTQPRHQGSSLGIHRRPSVSSSLSWVRWKLIISCPEGHFT